ncbi:MAG: hypothetical protein RL701_3161 [Pseudomonadota bacterium]
MCAARCYLSTLAGAHTILTELMIILALVLANGFFSGAEIALVALRKTRIQELAEEGRSSARAALALKENPERFLATVQVGITVVSAAAAAFGGESIATRIAPELRRISWIGDRAAGLSLALVIAIISYLSIVVGELVPKSLALRSAEKYALVVAKPLLALAWLTRPLIWFLGLSANVVLKPFGDRTTFTETRYSAEELQDLMEKAAQAGTIHPEAVEIAARALDLPDLTVADVMVPRQDVVVLPRHASPEQLQAILRKRTHSRMPVYEERIDNIVGYITVKDLLFTPWAAKPDALETILRPAYFVPESKLAVELMKEMRGLHMTLAIVVDELGGTSGIVTMEDLLEELVGDIFSEHAREVPELISQQADGSAIVSGTAPVRDVNRALGIELPEEGAWTTVAGLCLATLGRIPLAGDHLEIADGISLEVLDASPRRIRSVRVRPHVAASTD